MLGCLLYVVPRRVDGIPTKWLGWSGTGVAGNLGLRVPMDVSIDDSQQ